MKAFHPQPPAWFWRWANPVIIAAALGAPPACALDEWTKWHVPAQSLVGSLSCAAASCHGSAVAYSASTRISQQEYLHWLGSGATFAEGRRHYDPRARLAKAGGDPHAFAGQRLNEPRFQEVLQRVSNRPDGTADPQIYARCAQCHDPLGLAADEIASSSIGSPIGRGIGCESCHGGAAKWLTVHYQRGVSREDLKQLGLVDTKNVLLRARLCSACHIGSAEQDMNHDMIAAGHPPLRFELAAYEALLQPKHWNDGPQRLAEPDYEVRLWAAGRIAATEATLALTESRAKRASADAPWPELAEYNCFACHQSLRPEAGKLTDVASLDRPRSVPLWQTWNLALAELPSPTATFIKPLRDMRESMNASLLTSPQQIATLAHAALSSLRQEAPVGQTPTPANVLEIVSGRQQLTWDLACQELEALVAAEMALRNRGLATNQARQQASRIAAALRFGSDASQWPSAFPQPLPRPAANEWTLDRLQQELAIMRAELERVASQSSR